MDRNRQCSNFDIILCALGMIVALFFGIAFADSTSGTSSTTSAAGSSISATTINTIQNSIVNAYTDCDANPMPTFSTKKAGQIIHASDIQSLRYAIEDLLGVKSSIQATTGQQASITIAANCAGKGTSCYALPTEDAQNGPLQTSGNSITLTQDISFSNEPLAAGNEIRQTHINELNQNWASIITCGSGGGPSGSCLSLPTHATACGQPPNTAPSSNTNYTLIASSSACDSGSCEAYCQPGYTASGNSCVADTCQGAVPGGSDKCNGAPSPTNDTTSWHVVGNLQSSCDGSACSTYCPVDSYQSGGSCLANTCATVHPTDWPDCLPCHATNIPANNGTTWTVDGNDSASCATAACTAYAKTDYHKSGNTCLVNNCESTTNLTSLHATTCGNDTNDIPTNNQAYSLVASCGATPGPCTASCNSTYHLSAGSCVANACTGNVPKASGAVQCNTNPPVTNGKAYSDVASCGATPCTFDCPAPLTWDASTQKCVCSGTVGCDGVCDSGKVLDGCLVCGGSAGASCDNENCGCTGDSCNPGRDSCGKCGGSCEYSCTSYACEIPSTCDPATTCCSCGFQTTSTIASSSNNSTPVGSCSGSAGSGCGSSGGCSFSGGGGYENCTIDCSTCESICPSGKYDCFGVCNGPAKFDVCGVCGGTGSECCNNACKSGQACEDGTCVTQACIPGPAAPVQSGGTCCTTGPVDSCGNISYCPGTGGSAIHCCCASSVDTPTVYWVTNEPCSTGANGENC